MATQEKSLENPEASLKGSETKSGAEERVAPPGQARVSIRYCRLSNYVRVAEELERALREEFPDGLLDVDLVPSRGGVYEVSVNGRLVFSKRATSRLPDPEEIAYHVRVALGRHPLQGPFVPPSG
ncbi:MAG: Rdx family protein [Planctomycetota bacterium]